MCGLGVLGSAGHESRYGWVELVGLWTEDTECDDEEVSSGLVAPLFAFVCDACPSYRPHGLSISAPTVRLTDVLAPPSPGPETIDGRVRSEKENVSEEMRRISRHFSRNHAMSIHLNLIAILATIWYGFALASKVKMDA